MIDRDVFSQIGLDSGALTLLGTVIHQVERAGTYRLSVQRPAGEAADVTLKVSDEADAVQITIDLADVARDGDHCCVDGPAGREMRPGGHIVLHVGQGREAFAAVLAEIGEHEPKVVFDSRELRKGDRFVATVIRPGRYVVSNVASGATGRLEVGYPEPGKSLDRSPEVIEVAVTERTLRPASVSASPAQPIVYRAQASTHITIELEEPYDRKKARRNEQRPISDRNRRPATTSDSDDTQA